MVAKKTILITGSTDGIGLRTAKKLAFSGHKILLHGRNKSKLLEVAALLGRSCDSYVADLAKLDDITQMIDQILDRYDHLDVVINNAGVLKAPVTLTETGRDIRFEVNTIAPYLITQQLLRIMPRSGRVVNLSSAAQSPVDVLAMRSRCVMSDMMAYSQSKLAITIWSLELAKLLPDGPVVVSVNPGSLLATKMVREGFGIEGKDVNIGADILVKAALDDSFAGATGKYFDNDIGQFSLPNPAAFEQSQISLVMSTLEAVEKSLISKH